MGRDSQQVVTPTVRTNTLLFSPSVPMVPSFWPPIMKLLEKNTVEENAFTGAHIAACQWSVFQFRERCFCISADNKNEKIWFSVAKQQDLRCPFSKIKHWRPERLASELPSEKATALLVPFTVSFHPFFRHEQTGFHGACLHIKTPWSMLQEGTRTPVKGLGLRFWCSLYGAVSLKAVTQSAQLRQSVQVHVVKIGLIAKSKPYCCNHFPEVIDSQAGRYMTGRGIQGYFSSCSHLLWCCHVQMKG